jgi:hypothetical protein
MLEMFKTTYSSKNKGVKIMVERVRERGFADWIVNQFLTLEESLTNDELELLELVSRFEGFDNPTDYLISVVRKELSHYRKNLRFGRWLDDHGSHHKI